MNEAKPKIVVVGGGLAGVEAAYQCLNKGLEVVLYEMRPQKSTNAHHTGDLAELVCSNSFKSMDANSAPGLLKSEMKELDSMVLDCALKAKVEAGSALAVDRKEFSDLIYKKLTSFEHFTLIREEAVKIPNHSELELRNEIWIIATGPLTSGGMIDEINRICSGDDRHFFYDAIAPIIDSDSIDFSKGFWGNRWDQEGEPGDYYNLALDKEEYEQFVSQVKSANKVPLHEFEDVKYFESCLPIEVMIERGDQTLRFGPLKPIGFVDPKTGKRPWAVIQFRKENTKASMLSMVGFQTKMTWPEQKRIFQTLPGMENVEFFRMGSIHRNTYFECPKLINENLSLINHNRVFLAGQITGVEGYTESTAIGLIVGRQAAALALNAKTTLPPATTMIGSLVSFIKIGLSIGYQPMNANFGMLPPIAKKKGVSKAEKRLQMCLNAQSEMQLWLGQN